MRHLDQRRATHAGRLGIVPVALLALLAACVAPATSSGGPRGFAEAPAGLDPGSPSVSALNIAFDRTEFHVRAGTAFILVFHNRDGAPHNVSVYRDAAFKDRIFEGVVIDGVGTRWYPVPGLAFGTTYFFQCDVHPIPSMQGTLTAGL